MADGRVVLPEPEPPIGPDAEREAALFSSGDLRRSESVRNHVHMGGLVVFWTALIVILAMIVVWAWHMLTPDRYQFLNTEAKEKLQTILVSILGSSFVSGAARRWIDTPKKPS